MWNIAFTYRTNSRRPLDYRMHLCVGEWYIHVFFIIAFLLWLIDLGCNNE